MISRGIQLYSAADGDENPEVFEIESNLKHLIYNLLYDKTVFANWCRLRVLRKVPLWILVVNPLKKLEEGNCQVIAYADDVALMIKEKTSNY